MEQKQGRALVIGGSRGLGRAVVRAFSADGLAVTVFDRLAPLPEDAALPGVERRDVDLLDPGSIDRAMEEVLGAPDPPDRAVFLQRYRGDGDSWEGEIAVGLAATRRIAEALGEQMRPGGAMVMVASAAAHLVADEQPAGYHVVKAGTVQLARYLAVSLGPRGIRVNVVSPAVFVKDESRESDVERCRAIAAATPLRRVPTVGDIARVIAALCGPSFGIVTGQTIDVDGGLSLLAQASLIRSGSATP
jgi:NAD(P)-dependent dehydrogenase (short-subunit alcohol dehydrogenase family)